VVATKQLQVIKTIATDKHKSKHFKRIGKHSIEKRKGGHGDSRFFKAAQNEAAIKAFFRRKKAETV
jgi:hypothetical protein